jgi:hypothetical protein
VIVHGSKEKNSKENNQKDSIKEKKVTFTVF